MNTQQVKKLLMQLGYSFADFQKYMIGKTMQEDFYYMTDIEYFLYLKLKSKLNLQFVAKVPTDSTTYQQFVSHLPVLQPNYINIQT